MAMSGVGEDGFFSSKTCTHCTIAQAWLRRECGGFCYGMVEEDIRDHIAEARDTAPLSLAKLVVGMQRQWKRFYTDALMSQPKMPGTISGG